MARAVRRREALGGLLSAAALAGWDTGCKREVSMVREEHRMEGDLGGVAFAFAIRVDPEARVLRVDFTVQGPKSGEISVVNRLGTMGLDLAQVFEPDDCYVRLDGQALVVEKAHLVKLDRGTECVVRPVPVTRLLPGQTLRDGFSIPVPIEVCNPRVQRLLQGTDPAFREGDPIATRPAQAKAVQIGIGLFSLDRSVPLTPPHPAAPSIWEVEPRSDVLAEQKMLSAAFDLATPLAVLDYAPAMTPEER